MVTGLVKEKISFMITFFSNLLNKKTLNYFFGNFFSNFFLLVLIFLYAFYYTPNILGKFEYTNAISTFITPVIFLVIWESALKFFSNQKNDILTRYISNILFFIILVSVISTFLLSIIFLFFRFDINFIFITVLALIHGYVTFWQFSSRALNFSREYSLSIFLGGLCNLALLFTFIILNIISFEVLLFSHIISQFVIIFYLEYKLRLFKIFKFQFVKLSVLKELIVFSYPLVFNGFILLTYSSGVKIVIDNLLGSDQNGLYSFINKFGILFTFFSTVVSMNIIEGTYKQTSLQGYKDKYQSTIETINTVYMLLITILTLLVYIFFRLFFFENLYYESVHFVPFIYLILFYTSISNSYGSAFLFKNKTNLIWLTTLVGAVSGLIFSYVFIDYLGIYSPLVGMVFGSVIMAGTRKKAAFHLTGLNPKFNKSYFFALFLFTLTTIVSFLYNENVFILIGYLILTIVIIFISNFSKLTLFIKERLKQ